ncbi:MAG: phage portal protein, partial [Shimia sp.]|nr:phage portal protein [Shimia sp.]
MANTLLGRILNRAPVDLRPRSGLLNTALMGDPRPADLGQMGNVSALFAVVDGIAEGVGAARWRLWRGDTVDDPDRVEVTRHAALSVWAKPNPFQTTAEFVEACQQHYELTGEFWWVLSNQVGGREVAFPLELWNVRPDRIAPVPHPTEYISGYEYTGNQGEKVPLRLDQAIWNKRPNPLNPYRGLSPLGSLIYDTAGDVAAAKYNAMFFKNGADPGGIIEATNPIGDDEFDLLMNRWRESHKGVANAHRIGYLENARFVQANYT